MNDKTTNKLMKLFVLSHGYVAVVFHPDDIDTFGGLVVPLAFGSEIAAHIAVERMQKANPSNYVVFSGGLQEYRRLMALA